MEAFLTYVTVSSFPIFQSRAITVNAIFMLALYMAFFEYLVSSLWSWNVQISKLLRLSTFQSLIPELVSDVFSVVVPCSCYMHQLENCVFSLNLQNCLWCISQKLFCTFLSHNNFNSILRFSTHIYLKIFLDIYFGSGWRWRGMKVKAKTAIFLL